MVTVIVEVVVGVIVEVVVEVIVGVIVEIVVGGIQEDYRMEDPGWEENRMVICENKSLWVIVGVDISQ